MKKLLTPFLFCLLAATCLFAQKQECYVITAAGQRQKAVSIKADAQGNLTVSVDGKMKVPFKAGAYKIAVIPKPKEIADLEKLANDEKYEELITAAPAVFDAYKYLGWADAVAALQCEAYLATGKPEKANETYQLALKFPRENNVRLQRVQLLDLVGRKQYDAAEAEAKKLILSKDDALAAFAFNLRGQIREAQGQKKEAVLEYLKTILLFEGKGKIRRDREMARQKAVALMKELNDPRAAKIEALK